MFTKEKPKKKHLPKTTLIILCILLLLTGALALFFVLDNSEETAEQDNTVNTVNLDPPTAEEQAAGDEIKQDLTPVDDTTEDDTADLSNTAEVVIVDANQYENEIEVRAFVSNHVEAGECTIQFTQGETSFQKQVPASADASTSPCITLIVPRDDFPTAGEWTVNVEYINQSKTISGMSETTVIINERV